MRPNFLIIGAPKAGTTSLAALLGQHPEIHVPEGGKELRFFSHDINYAKGYDWYESRFAAAGDASRSGEASPCYSETHIFRETPARIAKHLPEARLIYILRHPVRRIESAWRQGLHTRHPMPTSFDRAVREYPHLLGTSRYWTHLNAFRRHFADDQIRLLFLEDLRQDPRALLRECCEFLDVDPDHDFEDPRRRRNVGSDKRMDRAATRAALRLPGISRLVSRMPDPARRLLRAVGRASIPSPEWRPETRRLVVRELKEEAEAVLEHAGRSTDFWRFDSVA